jgi:hypothetical protein
MEDRYGAKLLEFKDLDKGGFKIPDRIFIG